MKQLDMHIRMWDSGKVTTRFCNAAFMGHATAEDLFEQLQASVDLCVRNTIQLSMDGPNVNWKVFCLLSDDIQKRSGNKLIDIGSCGLHTIHNSFQSGHQTYGWDLGHWFSSLSWLFLTFWHHVRQPKCHLTKVWTY